MSKQTEALKLALEAAYLAGFNDSAEGYNGEYPFRDFGGTPTKDRLWVGRRDEYIREALAEQGCDYCNHPQYAGTKCKNCGREQPAQQPYDTHAAPGQSFDTHGRTPPPDCKTDAEKTAFAFGWWKALEENRKQPAQDKEPCGWRMKHNGEWAYSFTKDAWDFIYAVSPAARKAARDNAPASKPWVGLTDEERKRAIQFNNAHEALAVVIEAKLREKNA